MPVVPERSAVRWAASSLLLPNAPLHQRAYHVRTVRVVGRRWCPLVFSPHLQWPNRSRLAMTDPQPATHSANADHLGEKLLAPNSMTAYSMAAVGPGSVSEIR